MKHIICYSGGHSSAIVAIEVVRKFGKENCILLNHDIKNTVEDADIKRFKKEVADYLEMGITYANHPEWDKKDQFQVCIDAAAFKVGNGQMLCTNRLKTAPFEKYLKENFPDKDAIIYYGFDLNEGLRVQRRVGHLASLGFKSDYPIYLWTERTINSTIEIGIQKPLTYGLFKHGNCKGCLKAGKQHWYIIYLNHPDIFSDALTAEEEIGYSIMRENTLLELVPQFENMKKLGITTTEHEDGRTFFARVRKLIKDFNISEEEQKPCECTF